MIKEFILLALMQVPSPDQAEYELQPIEYHQTMRECELSRKVKLMAKDSISYQCLKRDTN